MSIDKRSVVDSSALSVISWPLRFIIGAAAAGAMGGGMAPAN